MTIKESLDQILDGLPQEDQEHVLEFAAFLRWRKERPAQRPNGLKEPEEQCSQAGRSKADDDIRAGRVKRFDNPDDMIASLKKPW